MKLLSKLPKELKIFLFIVSIKEMLVGMSLKELKEQHENNQNTRLETFFNKLIQ